MRLLQLNRKRSGTKWFKLIYTKVDEEDFNTLNQFNWMAKEHGRTIYAVRTEMLGGGRKRKVNLHRFLLGVNDPKLVIDHIDGDGLNNQRNNLRVCTAVENLRNRRPQEKSSSRFKGVTKASKNRFQARLTFNAKLIYIGSFEKEEDAAVAYNKAALKYYGSFSKLNIL